MIVSAWKPAEIATPGFLTIDDSPTLVLSRGTAEAIALSAADAELSAEGVRAALSSSAGTPAFLLHAGVARVGIGDTVDAYNTSPGVPD